MLPDPTYALLALAAGVVFAEGVNKLERADPLQPGLRLRDRAVLLMKVLAWMLLVLGAAGVFVRPFIVLPPGVPSTLAARIGAFVASDRSSLLLVLCGFALLVVRSRLKEKPPCERT